jgi:DNA-binding IclR family transcriptional regulator
MRDYVVRDGPGQYSLANAMRILELLVAEGPTSGPKLAERLRVGDRTVRRIMRRLAHDGYVERMPEDPYRKRWQPAPGLTALAGRVLSQADVSEAPS